MGSCLDREQVAKRRMAETADQTAKDRSFSPGDQVLVRVVDPLVIDGKVPSK